MKIDIRDIIVTDGEMFLTEFSESFAGVSFQGQSYDFPDGAYVKTDYFVEDKDIVVTGSFKADTKVVCTRCLEEFLYTVSFKFTEYYKEKPKDGEYTFAGDEVDLSQMLQDNLIMSLPVRHVCDEDCKGLCSVCGCDLNIHRCDCKPEVEKTNPFYGLSELIDDEEV